MRKTYALYGERIALAQLDSKLLEDPKIAKQALQMILRTKNDLDDLVDTLELLSNPTFKKNLEQGLKEARRGKALKLSTKELRKRLE
jgi:hypothetical protein